jgi:hypothetical protein
MEKALVITGFVLIITHSISTVPVFAKQQDSLFFLPKYERYIVLTKPAPTYLHS